MNPILKSALESKQARLAMFLAYVGRDVTHDVVDKYCCFYGVKHQAVWNHIRAFDQQGLLGKVYFNYWQTNYVFKQELFLEMARYMLENEHGYLLEFARVYPKRGEEAEFLWLVAEAYQKDDIEMAQTIEGDLPDEEAPLYLLNHVLDECLEDFFLGLIPDDMESLVLLVLVKSLCDDNGSVELFDRLLCLLEKSAEDVLSREIGKIDYLSDLVKCYRFFYDGMILPPTGDVPTYPYDVMTAIKALYEGKTVKSVSYFQEALMARNRQNVDAKEKNLFRNPLMCFYLILAYKKSDTDKDRTKVAQFLKKKILLEDGGLRPAQQLAKWVGGASTGEQAARDINWAHYLSHNRLQKSLVEILIGYFDLLGSEGDRIKEISYIPNYAILRHELSPYLPLEDSERERLTEVFGGGPVLPSIRKVEKWEEVLDDLSRIVGSAESKAPVVNESKERIGYFMNHDGSELEYRIQSRLRNGTWGAGKKAGQTDFFAGAIPCMDEVDKRVAAQARNWYTSSHVRSIDALPYLIGSDRVYTGSFAPYEQVNVIEEKPYIQIRTAGKRFALGSNIPRYRDLMSSDSVVVRKIDDATYSVILLSEIQRRLIRSFMQIETLPDRSSELLLKLLPELSKHIEVHSDLLEGGSSLTNVEGNPMLYCRLFPVGDEYQARFFVRPLDGGNMIYQPGVGDKVIYDQTGGERYQVTRLMRKEKENHRSLCDFLESVFDSDMFETEEMMLSPMEMLQLMEWISANGDICEAEWPEGRKVKVCGAKQSAISVSSLSGEDWFSIEGDVKMSDSDSVKIHQLLKLISSGNITGNYVRIDEERYLALTDVLRKQLKRLEAISQIGRGDVKVSKYNVGVLAELVHSKQSSLKAEGNLDSLMARIEESASLEPAVPEGLNATLRDYQYEGFRWMVRLAHWGAGACLADDMGLGKTVQAIAFMLYKASAGPSLVVAPASVIMNWANEIARFAPSLQVTVLNHATDRKLVLDNARAGHVILTTYGLLPQEEEILKEVHWNVICLDEAHTIKNRQTKMSGAAMGLVADSRIILTGTPVQNHLGEMWNLLQFLNPGLLGSFEQFSHKFITNENADLNSLRKMVQPFILRRTKSQVLEELPEKMEIVRNVDLSDLEMLSYESMRERIQSALEGEDKVTVNALAEITRLRQAACSMSLVDESWSGGSSKIDCFSELLSGILSSGNRVLVFSQFTSFLSMAVDALKKMGVEHFYLDGSTPIKKREQMVRDFQNGDKQVFVVSLKAGGLGLNLTGANYVIHLDPWWNPAIEQQATDRAHRIGQKQSVTVYHLISSHTIEEKILRLHKTKRDLADTFLLGTDVAHSLSIDDLRDLVGIDD